MPIVITDKDFSWSQTDSVISISIPTRSKTVDTYINSVYIKANYAPYFFELDLSNPIIPDQSTVTVADGQILFTLMKKQSNIWESLKYVFADADLVRERRRVAESEQLERVNQAKKAKNEEKMTAARKLDEVQAWKEDLNQSDISSRTDSATLTSAKEVNGDDLDDAEAVQTTITSNSQPVAPTLSLDDVEIDESELDMEAIRAKVRKQLEASAPRAPPPPRKSASITVAFTDRKNLPTSVAREKEDAKWQARIDEAVRKHEAITQSASRDKNDDAANIQERNPTYLREKGNTFYEGQSYEAAINAYSAALDLDDRDVLSLSNRSACYLQLSQFENCVNDCTRALDVLAFQAERLRVQGLLTKTDEDVDDETRVRRVKLHVRRGTARLRMNVIKDAVVDYEVAAKLDYRNEDLRKDYEGLKALLPQVA
ncbi:hypothetical protein SmJEL517_g02890 [Synchytrium microbalum]|uniref:CS domain-containing protein n=1 Tax=Synchytrium microbalum TaxID=1806994 RepID=A0A507C580_9FUNG|nr:uncharacterized protein SmJEL517_g02890 [Synchytrium microbalum]TPX34538.1 hypothetical protein SmJEL517_g02890 [Synchytrium microbalum]